ncbi:group III truncated hemoglobin [Hyphomicrobium sulfonivorans]|uniref:group III truncated hemoglobin n=1 Tax=Hyphomicrobium sulfonivorans TaxID=121290 RepID=UPI00156EE825|nr:group III truncated hemoglobin [Hyphomicrobium sulfonivorans]MBI1649613.1 group III truncated hemoglobin [Hyphomicrobium sulfonivorans]NSL71528.1 preprotein translocase subunit TatC [Hyphomicrobium sulfonivorans]
MERAPAGQIRWTADPRSPGFPVGITEATIHALVHSFYGRVQQDPTLGPIFAARVDDWPEHLEKMCAFWSSVVLMSGRYKGRPMPVHARITELNGAHFEHWLALFRATAAEVCELPAAAVFIDRAERIAQSLQMGIALHRDAVESMRQVETEGGQ